MPRFQGSRGARSPPFFRGLPNAVLELKTKTDNIARLLELEGGERTVVSWSVNPQEIVSRDKLTIKSPESALAHYTFNKHVIRHHFCPKCGCAPFGTGKDPRGNEMAAINVRCLTDVDLATIPRVPVDGRSR